jgi:hypothetical protein
MKYGALVLMTACFWLLMNEASYPGLLSERTGADSLQANVASDAGAPGLSDKPTLIVQLGFIGGVKSVVLSYDGQFALTGSFENGKLLTRLWDTKEGKELRRFGGSAIGFSRDSRLALTTEGVWDSATGVRMWKGVERHEYDRKNPYFSARRRALVGRPEGFSPDDRYVALIQDEAVLWMAVSV